MAASAKTEIKKFMLGLEKRNPGEPEFQQAVREVAETSATSSKSEAKAGSTDYTRFIIVSGHTSA